MQELIYSQVFLPAVEQYGESEAIVDGDYRSNWNEHAERVSRLCHGLAHQLEVTPSGRMVSFGGMQVMSIPRVICF